MLLMGNLTISMAMFNSYVELPEGSNNASHKGFCLEDDLSLLDVSAEKTSML